MFELGNDAGESGFDRCNRAVRVILALLFQTAPMFEELFPIKIGKVGPGPRLRLRHLGVNSVYESGARLSTINRVHSAISRAPRAATKPPSAPTAMPASSTTAAFAIERNTSEPGSIAPANQTAARA